MLYCSVSDIFCKHRNFILFLLPYGETQLIMIRYHRNGGKRPSGQNIGVLALILVITLIAVTVMNNMVRKNQTQELGYEEFVEYLKEGEIDTAKISSNRIYLTPKTSSTKLSRFIQYYTVRIPDVDLAERLLVRARVF